MIARILAVLAAIFLVGAAGMAMLQPPGFSLDQTLLSMDPKILATTEAAVRTALPSWVWDDLAAPLLVRPAWLLPAAVGIIFAGLALSVTPKRGAPRQRRRN